MMQSNWKPGKILLGEYRILRELGHGGMGRVYLVERELLTSKIRHAVKTLLQALLGEESNRRSFLNELSTWIELPRHPNLTACHFFKTVEDRLAIFAEYVEGGSLKDWIFGKKLKDTAAILDIAIQIARGLSVAHECGVIHQDMKPANILMSPNGVAKITDFGLSRAVRQPGFQPETLLLDTHLVSSKGMTPAYCSPEQAEGVKLSFKTDIWSWGLTVFQMFTGEVYWKFGIVANQLLEHYKPAIDSPTLPDSIAAILSRCFKTDPRDRFESMDHLLAELENAYRDHTGIPYPRANKGVQKIKRAVWHFKNKLMKRQGTPNDPFFWMNRFRALADQNQGPSSAESTLHFIAGSLRSISFRDLEILENAEAMYNNLAPETRATHAMEYSDFLMLKGLTLSALQDHPAAVSTLETGMKMLRNSTCGISDRQTSLKLARLLRMIAVAQALSGDYSLMIEYADKAIWILKSTLCYSSSEDFIREIIAQHANKAYTFWMMGRYKESIRQGRLACNYISRIRNPSDPVEFLHMKCTALLNLGLSHYHISHYREAMRKFNRVIRDSKRFLETETDPQVLIDLGAACANKALVLKELGNVYKAHFLLESAQKYLEKAVQKFDQRNQIRKLILIHVSSVSMLILSERIENALKRVRKALHFTEHCIYIEGHTDLYCELVRLLYFYGKIEYERSNYVKAEKILNKCLDACSKYGILDQITEFYGSALHSCILKAKICSATGRIEEAENLFRKALEMIQPMDQANPVIIEALYFIHMELADCFRDRKLYPKAIKLYRLVQLEIRKLTFRYRQHTCKTDLGRAMAGEAICFYMENNNKQATRLASKALRLLESEYRRTRIPSIKRAMNELKAFQSASS